MQRTATRCNEDAWRNACWDATGIVVTAEATRPNNTFAFGGFFGG